VSLLNFTDSDHFWGLAIVRPITKGMSGLHEWQRLVAKTSIRKRPSHAA